MTWSLTCKVQESQCLRVVTCKVLESHWLGVLPLRCNTASGVGALPVRCSMVREFRPLKTAGGRPGQSVEGQVY